MFGFLSIDWEKHFFPVQLVAKNFHVRDVISIKQWFDLENLSKQVHHQQKSQKICETNIRKKNRSPIKLRLGNFEHINRGWVKFCSHIPTGDYTEGLKALKTTGNGNCLYNSVSVLIQGDESANLILRLSVTNALHNKRVIYRQCYILS